MDRLPPELILQIAYYSFDIVKLHLVSKRLQQITRDVEFWKRLCFEDSNSAAIQKRRDLQFIAPNLVLEPARVFELQRRARTLSATPGFGSKAGEGSKSGRSLLADWDPAYEFERIDWYEEYVARHARISMSWLEQPTDGGTGIDREVKGLGIYEKGETSLAIAPLDDGSVSIWHIGREDEVSNNIIGAITARSKPSLLSTLSDGNDSTSTSNGVRLMKTAGIVEGVSVDIVRNKAYFATHNDLQELDLETSQLSSQERYPFAISALSDATHPVPLTVATTHSLHIHDSRQRCNIRQSTMDPDTRVEGTTATLPSPSGNQNDFHRILNGDPYNKHAPLFQPGPLSITHLHSSDGQHDATSGHICVAGRFPSILTYDRRTFPRLSSTIHSGSRLSSMTSLPYPLLHPRSGLPSDHLASHTLIACGEYNGKGTLELYPFSTAPSEPSDHNNSPPSSSSTTAPIKVTPYKNRTSASRSKLLSITPHGTRLVFSDSDGGLKWVERDGHSLVRRWNINAYTASARSSLSNPDSQSISEHASGNLFGNGTSVDGGNVARKLLPVRTWGEAKGELAVWTGEKVGLLGFRPRPRFEWEGEREALTEEGRQEVLYKGRMRQALERQANEVRFVRGLGMGGASG
ncbi:MAG: hypothetical protein Q9220_002594 [cf. Caloplaca sp. 1 TL-2023]